MSVTSTRQNLSKRALDPVFICMVGAIILAVASSVGLRAMIGAAPAAAHASDHDSIPAPRRAPADAHPTTHPELANPAKTE